MNNKPEQSKLDQLEHSIHSLGSLAVDMSELQNRMDKMERAIAMLNAQLIDVTNCVGRHTGQLGNAIVSITDLKAQFKTKYPLSASPVGVWDRFSNIDGAIAGLHDRIQKLEGGPAKFPVPEAYPSERMSLKQCNDIQDEVRHLREQVAELSFAVATRRP